MIRIAICDDHPIVRKGLSMILSQTEDISLALEASDYGELQRKLKNTECDVLLIDIEMPGKNGIDVIPQLKLQLPKLAIIVVSAHSEQLYGFRALRAGAMGYLNKESAPENLVEAIRCVAIGKKFISPALIGIVTDNLIGSSYKNINAQLSDRELQVLRLIASGEKLSAIAKKLSLSSKTVSVYRARIMAKLQLQGNVDIAHYAVKHGLIDPPP